MPEKVVPGPVSHEERSIREAVCVHTRKIFDSCKEEDTAPLIRKKECRYVARRAKVRRKSPDFVFLSF